MERPTFLLLQRTLPPPPQVSTMVNTPPDRSPERARQDYVKVIYQLGEETPVRAAELARHLGVSRASVSKFKRMLERENLLHPSRRPTDALRLTKKGQQLALRMVRRHRLVETFLHATLRMPLERVHKEAERIEHAISDDVSARLARFLEHPSVDPHGHRIPDGSTKDVAKHGEGLASLQVGSHILVTSIDDHDPTTVRRLAALRILPGLRAVIASNDGGLVRLRAGKRRITISHDASRGVRCASTSRHRDRV
jgi:DtxR family transcriptional regulator, Mn-dependent transcriptional regulator